MEIQFGKGYVRIGPSFVSFALIVIQLYTPGNASECRANMFIVIDAIKWLKEFERIVGVSETRQIIFPSSYL